MDFLITNSLYLLIMGIQLLYRSLKKIFLELNFIQKKVKNMD